MLKQMMIERFKAWIDQDAPPTQILYYRDSISFDDYNIRVEYKDIRTAYGKVWPEAVMPHITMVVYGKNAQVTFLPEEDMTGEEEYEDEYENRLPVRPELIFTLSPPSTSTTTGPGPQKHAYYVSTNEIGLTASELRDLTRNINTSSQLSPQNDQTTKPLPLIWATKLSARVHEYYHDEFLEQANARVFSVDDMHHDDQTEIVKRVEKILGLKSGREGELWNEGLEGRMFWL
jgi:hypothetical protein